MKERGGLRVNTEPDTEAFKVPFKHRRGSKTGEDGLLGQAQGLSSTPTGGAIPRLNIEGINKKINLNASLRPAKLQNS